MPSLTDPEYLQTQHYRDASNLNARIHLHQRFSTNSYGWMRWLFDHYTLPARCHILEVGCGPGDLWRDNASRIPVNWALTLSDFSAGMVRQARENLQHVRMQFTFAVLDAQVLPFPSETFDAVVANMMLYYVPDRRRALTAIHRVLKPGGRFYAASVGPGHMRELNALIQTIDPGARLAAVDVEFGLHNGAEQLAPFFSQITCHRYQDALVITEVEPLVAYVLSTDRSALIAANPKRLAQFVERRIQTQGAIVIHKDSGMFEAVKAGRSAQSTSERGG